VKFRLLPALAAAAILSCAGCRLGSEAESQPQSQSGPEPALEIRYLPGFVPGTRDLFAPTALAIAPPQALLTQGRVKLGSIFNAEHKVERKLYAEDAGKTLAESLARGFADAGLKPAVLTATPPDHRPPPPAQFLLVASLDRFQVDKLFHGEDTVHGPYFTMHSLVRIGVELFDRDGRALFSGSVSGAEDEPPPPVGGEVFLPLETEPSESLSVALSRAVGAIILAPEIRRALPQRA
jgi:hypothetical protein